MPAKLKKTVLSEDICFILAINSLSVSDQKKKKKKREIACRAYIKWEIREAPKSKGFTWGQGEVSVIRRCQYYAGVC